MKKQKTFKVVEYNHEIISDVLSRYTNDKFTFDSENESFMTAGQYCYYQVSEGDFYRFDLIAYYYDSDTGGHNDCVIGSNLDLPEIINKINAHNWDLKGYYGKPY